MSRVWYDSFRIYFKFGKSSSPSRARAPAQAAAEAGEAAEARAQPLLDEAVQGLQRVRSGMCTLKFLPDGDGNPGARNDLRCVSLEHKMGMHASPTAVMSYGDDGGATPPRAHA